MQEGVWRHDRLPNLEQGRGPRISSGLTVREPSAGCQGAMPNPGRVHPQKEVTGVPNAAAKCIIPVSPVHNVFGCTQQGRGFSKCGFASQLGHLWMACLNGFALLLII